MGRLVTARVFGAKAAAGGDQDAALARIGKYIPAEILAFFAMWTQGTATLAAKPMLQEYLGGIELVGAIIGLVVTYIYFDRFFPQSAAVSRNAHKWISTLAFGVHAYNLSAGAVSTYFVPGVALLATAVITLVSAVYIPTEKPNGN